MSPALDRSGSVATTAPFAKLDEPLDKALASARPAAESVIDTFKALSPNEMSVEFGLNI